MQFFDFRHSRFLSKGIAQIRLFSVLTGIAEKNKEKGKVLKRDQSRGNIRKKIEQPYQMIAMAENPKTTLRKRSF